MKDQSKGFYTKFEVKEKDIAYANKDFDKVIVNFIKIGKTGSRYHLFFFLKFKLHKHIKTGYIERILLFSFIQSFSFISIIVMKVIYQSVKSGLVFMG